MQAYGTPLHSRYSIMGSNFSGNTIGALAGMKVEAKFIIYHEEKNLVARIEMSQKGHQIYLLFSISPPLNLVW